MKQSNAKILGDSMQGAGIFSGDLVIVDRSKTARHGDIVIAAKSAYFLQAFVNIGLVPDVGSTWLLPRLAGKARAQAMMMLGERIPAETAAEWGMIYKVVDDAELAAETRKIAVKLANGPTKSLALIRSGIRECLDKTLTDGGSTWTKIYDGTLGKSGTKVEQPTVEPCS